jgi:4-hydroxysphinganine ceramide fatty acyl 2-hydroxylase
MRYLREFCAHRLILFLMAVALLSGTGMLLTVWSNMNWLGIAFGLVLFIVIEYLVHRYVLHEFPNLAPAAYQGHVAHHQYPNDDKYLFGPVSYDFFGYLFYFALGWLITRNASLTSAMIFGSVVCQIYYQWKHFVSHRPIVPLTPWGKWMKKKHLLHHHLDENAWYGVSNPFMDILMKTNVATPKKAKSEASNNMNG